MTVQLEKKDDGSILISVVLSKEKVRQNYKDAIAQIKLNTSIKGFRKGSVPTKIIEQNFSDRVFLAFEEIALSTSISKVLEFKKVKPVLNPEIKITKSVPGESFEYEMIVIPQPFVGLGKYTNLNFKRKTAQKINEEEINKALNFLRQSRATFKTIDGPARKGQHVEIAFEAFFNGKKNEKASEKFYPLRLGESPLHPDFEKEIYGMKTGEKKSFNIKFHSNWPQKEFAGKTIKFNITVNAIQDVNLPVLDDAFAMSLGQFSTLDILKKSLREGLGQEKKQQEEDELKNKILKKVVEDCKISVPKMLISKEKDNLKNNFFTELEKKNLTLDKYLNQAKLSQKDLDLNFEKHAKTRLESMFVVNKIAKKENLFPSKQEVELEMDNWTKKIKNSKQSPKDIDLERLESYTFEYLTNNKVINWLLDKNTCV